MHVVKNNRSIVLTRGDTCKILLVLTTQDGSPFVPTNEVIRFAAKRKYTDLSPCIKKVIPNDTLILHLKPEDTKSLDFGKYVYDIQITYPTGEIDTFVTNGVLEITEEVD